MKTFLKKQICALNYQLGRFDDLMFLLGDGRSGTTWIEEILNCNGQYREMFEPFHGRNGMRLEHGGHYPYSESDNQGLLRRHIRKVLRGDFINLKVSYTIPRVLFSGLFIKDISAHFILDAIVRQKPHAHYVMVLRHPFAVALSKSKAWEWHTDLEVFLSELNPHRNILEPHRDLMRSTRDPLLVYVLVWCILHKTAFSSEAISSFNFIFYEPLAHNPEQYFDTVFEAFGKSDYYKKHESEVLDVLKKKSRLTSEDNSIRLSKQGSSKWMTEWPEETVEAGIKILEAFGLDFMYDRGHFPKLSGVELKERIIG